MLTIDNPIELEGRWLLKTNESIFIRHSPEIIFKSNSFTLRSYGDTVYSGIYKIEEKVLTLNFKNTKNKINVIYIANDSLLLSGFFNTSDTLLYVRLAASSSE